MGNDYVPDGRPRVQPDADYPPGVTEEEYRAFQRDMAAQPTVALTPAELEELAAAAARFKREFGTEVW